jgi:hypothetical protein
MNNFLNDIYMYRNTNELLPIITATIMFCLFFILLDLISWQLVLPLYCIILYYSSYFSQSYIYNSASKSMYGITWGIIITIISVLVFNYIIMLFINLFIY